jgi:hypothetical protein
VRRFRAGDLDEARRLDAAELAPSIELLRVGRT